MNSRLKRVTKISTLLVLLSFLSIYSSNTLASDGYKYIPLGFALGYLAHYSYNKHSYHRGYGKRYYGYSRGYKRPYYGHSRRYYGNRYYGYKKPYYGKRYYNYGYRKHY